MRIKRICVLGGSGFVGQHVVNRFVRDGYAVRVLTRDYERSKDVTVMPTVELVEANIHDPATLVRQFADCDAVVNLVGILNPNRRASFQQVHVELPRNIVEACRRNRVKRLLHMSALHADVTRGPSEYLRTKGEGEELVHAAGTERFRVTSFRPSVIFGPDDGFFNLFANLLRFAPLIFPLACPKARFAPVYVGDLAEAFRKTLADPGAARQRFDLCGPHEYTLKELVAYTAHVIDVRRWIIGLPDFLSRLQAKMLQLVPGKPMSMDNYRSMQIDSVCAHNDLKERLDIDPTGLEAVVPQYLAHRTWRARYQAYRQRARRS